MDRSAASIAGSTDRNSSSSGIYSNASNSCCCCANTTLIHLFVSLSYLSSISLISLSILAISLLSNISIICMSCCMPPSFSFNYTSFTFSFATFQNYFFRLLFSFHVILLALLHTHTHTHTHNHSYALDAFDFVNIFIDLEFSILSAILSPGFSLSPCSSFLHSRTDTFLTLVHSSLQLLINRSLQMLKASKKLIARSVTFNKNVNAGV